MASKDKVFERRNNMIKELEKGSISVKKMAEILGIKDRSVESDVKTLREAGFEIEIKKGIITLRKSVEIIKESSTMDVRAVSILMLLGESIDGLSKTEIENKLLYDISYDFELRKKRRKKKEILYSDLISKNDDALRKRVESDLNRLVEQRRIVKVGDKYNVAMNTSIQISLTDRNLDKIYRELVNNCDNNTYGDILYIITKKIYDTIDLKLYGENICKINPIILQNEKSSFDRYKMSLKRLFEVDYKSKRLKIKSFNRYKESIDDTIISIGIIVFVVDEGSFYIIGKTDRDYVLDNQEERKWRKHYTPIKLSRVKSIEEVGQINQEYGKEEYEKVCSEMYKFSVENSFSVKLEYKNTPRNIKKVKRYSLERETFKIEEIVGDKITCSDKVRGKHDYERFLRKEGNDVYVLYPQFVIMDMIESAKKIIERYNNE